MTLLSLATKNIKRNISNYFLYFVSIVINVMIFYMFESVRYNKQLENLSKANNFNNQVFILAAIVIGVFAIIFVWNSTTFFVKKRKKEIGIYSLVGVKKKQIGRMMFYENIIIGLLALLVGIFFGTVLTKLFMMILFRVMELYVPVEFYISFKAIKQTFKVFGIFFFITSLHSYRIIYKFKLVELFKASKEKEKEPKTSVFWSIISIFFIGFGYALVNSKELLKITNDFSVFFYALILVILGTFIFFNNFLIYTLKKIKKSKKIFYKGSSMIAVSNLLFRIKGNARSFAIISILSAATVTAVSSSWIINNLIDRIITAENRFDYVYTGKDKVIDKKVEKAINKSSNNKLKFSVKTEVIEVDIKSCTDKNFENYKSIYLISESKFNQLSNIVYNTDQIKLKNKDEGIILSSYYKINKKENLQMTLGKDGNKFKIVDFKNQILNRGSIGISLVVKDEIYKKYYDTNNSIRINAYMITNRKDSKYLTENIKKIVPKEASLNTYYDYYKQKAILVGAFLFIGVFVGIVFLISTTSIIYFKTLAEAYEDRERYAILKKIGMSKKEICKSIKEQIRPLFFIPLLVGIFHSIAALGALRSIMNITSVKLIVTILLSYIVIYYIYYMATISSYKKIVTININ
ncbi:FtsX-like permease family protein [Haloimpatiens sp. FM7330]|uniref:FtsX-like permease family protein n=1 Tax=Haloimpatiens sp. FM7330 TaxID=3298610 RepID=UPI0036306A9A